MPALVLLLLLCAGGGSDIRVVRLVATSDLHGQTQATPDFLSRALPRRLLGGWTSLAREIDRHRDQNTLVVDLGDFAFGSVAADTQHGRPVVEFMNRVGYHAATLGARDFSGGLENLEVLARMAAFPVLADPLLNVALNRRAALFRPFEIKMVNGVRVALVALVDPEISKLNRLQDTRGLAFGSPAAQLSRYLPALGPESADVVVVFGHFSAPVARQLADSFPQVAAVFFAAGGSTISPHARVIGVPDYGQRIVVADMLLDLSRRSVDQLEARLVDVIPDALPTDTPRVLNRVEFAPDGTGRVTAACLLAQSIIETVDRADVAIVQVSSVEGGLVAGPVSLADLRRVAPFGERLRCLTVSETTMQRIVASLGPADTAPAIAGVDYFVLGDTVPWPTVGRVVRLRPRYRRTEYRVVASEATLDRAGLIEQGRIVEPTLTELWLKWCTVRQSIPPAQTTRRFQAGAGLPGPARSSELTNVNTASIDLLATLPGIGPKTAARIVEYREIHGRFASVEELRNVKGIGPKRLASIIDLVTVR